jgi:hypothetical protein
MPFAGESLHPLLAGLVRDSAGPLADAAKAHERLAAGHVLGKIVLRTHQT